VAKRDEKVSPTRLSRSSVDFSGAVIGGQAVGKRKIVVIESIRSLGPSILFFQKESSGKRDKLNTTLFEVMRDSG
jgi:hypothetical protein